MANLSQIRKYLDQKNIKYEVIDLEGEVFTVKGVSGAGVNDEQIVKTLVIRANGDFVALAVRGKDRVDFKKVRKLFGSKSELARPKEVERIVGVPVGAVCPILVGIPLYFDGKVMGLKHVNMGSGDLTCALEMDFADFQKAIGKYKIEDLVVLK